MHVASTDMILIIPAVPDSYGVIQKAHAPEFHLGVGYIASFLESRGRKVDVIDMTVGDVSVDQVVDAVAQAKPRLVGLTVVTSHYSAARELVNLLRNRLPEVLFIAGGPHPTARPNDCLTDGHFDLVAIGEGERTCAALLEVLDRGDDLASVPGLAMMNGSEMILTGAALRIELDQLPWPKRNKSVAGLYKNQFYFDDPEATSYNLITTRGCPYRCTFCGASTVFPGKMRRRSAGNVFAEMEWAYRELGVEYFFFEDSTFVFAESLVNELCRRIIDSGMKVQWGAMGRLNHVNEKLYTLMKQSGCKFLFFGVESGNDGILKTIRKNFTVAEVRKSVAVVKKLGIACNCSFILGLPGETERTLNQTIDLAVGLNPEYVSFSLATPYPDAELWDQCLADGWSPPDWLDYQTSRYRDPIYVPSGLSAQQLKTALGRAYRRFYFRPRYAWRHLRRISSFTTLRRDLGAALSLAWRSALVRK